MNFASPLLSAITMTSLGPAMKSMPTSPYTCLFAYGTYLLPGPTILSTEGIVFVPYANAPIAWAPPTENILSAPAMSAATMVAGAILGEQTMTDCTPATLAGIMLISADEGRGYLTPGT